MKIVSMKAGAHAFGRTAHLEAVWIALILALGPAWGCGGVTNGKTPQGPTAQNLSISGTISPSGAGNGSTVALSGVSTASATADTSGNYTFTGLANGTYVVAPNHTGYSFAPGTQAVTLNGTNATGVNFTGTSQQTYSISGTISPITGGAGATVTLGGASAATTMSDSAGSYTFTGLLSGSYSVTPTNRGFSYTPTKQSVTLNAASVPAINFTATPQATHTVSLTWNGSSTATVTGYNVYRSTASGTLFARVNNTPVTGLAYTDSTVQNGVTYYFVTTAVDPIEGESVFSNQVSAVIP